MAIADLDTYQSLLASPYQTVQSSKQPVAASNGRFVSTWLHGNVATGSAPTTAVAPTSATAGAMGQLNGGASALFPMSVKITSLAEGTWLLCDRLSHQGGLDGTSTSAQTTNLPTAALTRYTSGVGVWPCLEIYSALGSTATTATISYTDDAGNSGQTSQATVIGGTGWNGAGRLIPMGLASGDTGARAVASVTLLATTGTVGNFGVTLIKPLLAVPVMVPRMLHDLDALFSLGCQIPEIVDDACLFWALITGSAGSTGTLEAIVRFSEA